MIPNKVVPSTIPLFNVTHNELKSLISSLEMFSINNKTQLHIEESIYNIFEDLTKQKPALFTAGINLIRLFIIPSFISRSTSPDKIFFYYICNYIRNNYD